MVGEALDGGLKHRELVRNERVRVHEVLVVDIGAVGLRPVGEAEQRFEIGGFLPVERLQGVSALSVLLQEAFADDFFDVAAGELEAGGEAGLDFGEVVALCFRAVPDNLVHVLLAGDEDPGEAGAFGVQ